MLRAHFVLPLPLSRTYALLLELSDTSIHEQKGDVRVQWGEMVPWLQLAPLGGEEEIGPSIDCLGQSPHPMSKLWVGIRKLQSSQQCLLGIEYNSMS